MAYETDSHFDLMYHLARSVGIADGTAKFLAIANQHIDVSAMSSPMLSSVQRQLFHFPGNIEKVEIEGHGSISLPSRIFKSKLALAERNSAIGNYLIYLGLQRGDLMLVGLGMHTKMDTYGHAGHSNIIGHMEAGHNPDRAFLEAKKYEDMIRSMIQGLVSVRDLLPKESVDKNSALMFLNKWAPKTHLKRELTLADLEGSKAATIISGVVLADDDMLGIYREDVFKKFEYKKFALRQVYRKFKQTGEIHKDIKFEELFPDHLLQNRSMDAKDVLRHVIMTTADAEFLKAEGGKEIFDLKKLFGIKSEEIFNKKFQVEVDRAEFRLREMFNMELALAEEENSYEKRVQELKEIEKSGQNNELYAGSKLQELREERQRLDIKVQRLMDEKLQLLDGAKFDVLGAEYGSEEFIHMRAREFAEGRNAEEISIKLFKDLIPMKPNEYIKQNFEGEPETRKFETEYKSEAHRLARIKNWGVNFLYAHPERSNVIRFVSYAIDQFRKLIRRNATPAKIEEWKEMARKSAADYLDMDARLASADDAEFVRFDKKNRRDALFKLTAYVGPAIFPWLTGNLSGYSYIKKLVARAKAYAKDYEVENMQEALREGKYREFLGSEKSKKAFDLIRKFEKKAVIQCERLFAL